MTRKITTHQRVALLATGDELSHGDILNTNSQEIAKRLFHSGIPVGLHVVAPDTISEIKQSIDFVLQTHNALIITGGLGPTSDDLTRFALSEALDKELVFDEATWELIVSRLKKFGYNTPPETNRQQALFPKDAIIIPNPHGTAAGCVVKHNNQLIFMLPGPPMECLPMVDNVVVPQLKAADFQQLLYFDNWYLFGVSEGQIAEELDAICKPYACTTGYRLAYPYIEFKLFSNQEDDFLKVLPLIQKAIASYLIGDGKQTASQLLQDKLSQPTSHLTISDLATGGLLESTLRTPLTHSHLNFSSIDPDIEIKGLSAYWQKNGEPHQTELIITFLKTSTPPIKVNIPFRGSRVKFYAVEYICQQILSKMI